MSFTGCNLSNIENTDFWDLAKYPPYETIDKKLKCAEVFFNKAGLIPGVSLVTGQIRASFGFLEIVIGLALICFHQVGAKFASNENLRKRLYKQAEIDFSYCINGLGNIIRGSLEKVSLYSTTLFLFSKLVLLGYNEVGLRFNYGHEKASDRDIPLLRSFIIESREGEA